LTEEVLQDLTTKNSRTSVVGCTKSFDLTRTPSSKHKSNWKKTTKNVSLLRNKIALVHILCAFFCEVIVRENGEHKKQRKMERI